MASLPTTMKALVVEKVGAPPEIRNDIPVPVPSDTQILVKSIYTAVNPVDALLSTTGMLVESFPLVPGCDAGGIVVQSGSRAFSPLGPLFKPGGQVFGCTRLGSWGYSPWQEYHLLDAHITLPKPSTITLAQASTLGVSLLTASLGIFSSLEIPLPSTSTTTKTSTSTPTPQWALLLGGASSVGKSALQLFKASGYLVLATCSPKDSETLKNLGADETLDYKTDAATLIANIKKITNGGQDILYAFDAVASNNSLVSELFNALSPPAEIALLRRYTTTNDWDPLPTSTSTPPTFTSSPIALGLIGRDAELDKKLTSYIPSLVRLFEEGKIKPSEYSVEGEGIEGIGKAWDVQKSGRMGGTKVVVKIADEE